LIHTVDPNLGNKAMMVAPAMRAEPLQRVPRSMSFQAIEFLKTPHSRKAYKKSTDEPFGHQVKQSATGVCRGDRGNRLIEVNSAKKGISCD
jgi:hypothetical protein